MGNINSMQNKDLKKRIIEISYKLKLSHLGSCLTAVDIIKEIFDQKKPDEKFVLSSGHAGLALYVVLEEVSKRDIEGMYGVLKNVHPIERDAEKIFNHHGVHPDRCADCGIDFSTGSLGQGLPAAVGMALADRKKNVYCLISDGECAEGSIAEAMRIAAQNKLDNLHVYVNINGWAAYQDTDWYDLPRQNSYVDTVYRYTTNELPFLHEIDAHYHVMTEEEYGQAMEILK